MIYQVFPDAATVQWEQVRNYVDPPADYNNDPLCDPAVTPAGENNDDTSWSPYWWTPTCPASQDPTSFTFQATLFPDGGVIFSYKDMPAIDTSSPSHRSDGTGLSWSKASIGYEDHSGTLGDQITYNEIPAPQTAYYIPPACTPQSPPQPPMVPEAAQCPKPCIMQGMDYGGGVEPFSDCGFAPIIAIYTDNTVWAENHRPGWYSGEVIADEDMTSEYECQKRCAATDGCDFFSYEWESTADSYYHEWCASLPPHVPPCHGL